MATDLTFNIAAIDKATTTFVKLAGQVDRLSDRLDALDRKRANPEVDIDTSKAQAELDKLQAEAEKSATDRSRETGSLMAAGIALGLSTAAPLVAGALVGGVSLGFVGMAAEAQKNNAAVVAGFANLKNQVVSEMTGTSDQVVPYLVASEHQLQQSFANLGPELRTAFSFAGPDIKTLTDGVDNFATNAMPGLVSSMRNSQPVVQGVATVLGDMGTTAGTLAGDMGKSSDEIEVDLDKIGNLVKNVGSVAGAAFPGLINGAGSAIQPLATVLSVLKPIAPELGDIAGDVLPVVGNFKLFGALGGPIGSLGEKVSGLSSKTGGLTQELTGSSTVASKVSSATDSMGKGITAAGNALPLLGAGLAVADVAAQHFFGDADELAQKLTQGGDASVQAATKLAANDGTVAGLTHTYGGLVGSIAGQFIPTTQQAEAGMTNLQKAQVSYQVALSNFGALAPQTVAAQKALADASNADSQQQHNLALAEEDVTQRLVDQENALLASSNANLGYQGALLNTISAQQTYAAAVKKSGGNSLDARQALVQLEDQQNNTIGSAVKLADAQNVNSSADVKAKAESDAYTGAVLSLVAASKGHLTPALADTASHLDSSGLAAFRATGKVSGLHQEVIQLPDGKTIKINVNSNGQAVASQTQRAIDGVHGKTVAITAVENIVLGKTPSAGVAGIGGLLGLPHRALGGSALAGRPIIVGDGGGPEIFVPRQSGDIIGTAQSAAILAGGGLAVKPPKSYDSALSSTVAASLFAPEPTRTAAQDDVLVKKLDELLRAIQNYPPVTVYGSSGQSVDQIATEVIRRLEFHGR